MEPPYGLTEVRDTLCSFNLKVLMPFMTLGHLI